MDVTREVCEVSPSIKRVLKTLRRHGVEVVICRKDSQVHQLGPQSHGNFGDYVHPSGDSGSNRESCNASSTVTEMFRNEYLLDSSSGQLCWTKRDTLSLKNLLQSQFQINLQSCSRRADLHVRPAGKVNQEYLGTLVAIQTVYNSSSCIQILVVAKLNLFSPPYDAVKKELSDNLLSKVDGTLYVLSRNSLNQWKLEKWR